LIYALKKFLKKNDGINNFLSISKNREKIVIRQELITEDSLAYLKLKKNFYIQKLMQEDLYLDTKVKFKNFIEARKKFK
jgi:hypothetical protein